MRVITILSLPRSGTSLAARIISGLGASVPEDSIEPDPDINPDGFFESATLLGIRSELEGILGLNFAFPLCWCDANWNVALQDPRIMALAGRAKDYFTSVAARDVTNFVFKDPRTVAVLPFWQHVFDDNDIKPHYVIALREPLAVARSISRFNNHSLTMGTLLWLDSVWQCLNAVKAETFTLLTYEGWFENTDQIRDVSQSIFSVQPSDDVLRLIKEDFIKPRLNHNKTGDSSDQDIIKYADHIYALLSTLPVRSVGVGAKLVESMGIVEQTLKVLGNILHPHAFERMLDFDRRNFVMEQRIDALNSEIATLREQNSRLTMALESSNTVS